MNLPNRSNTCIVIVTFNPDSEFKNNLLQHLEIADKIVIIDNNSDVNIDSFISKEYLNRIEIIYSKSNKGIAWALNAGINRAKCSSIDWVLTFDQDSFPNKNILSYYSEVLKNEKNVGIIGTNFSSEIVEITKVSWENKITIITSGTLHPMQIFEKINFYNEKLFIDDVDFDFSLRVSMAGFNVIRIKEPLIKHTLGSPINKYGLNSSNHNLIRRYYYGRNHVYLTKTYFSKHPYWIFKKNYFFLKSIIVLIIVEDNVINKISSILKGVKDGFKNF